MLLCFDYDGVVVDSFAVLLSYCQHAQRALGAGRPPQAEDLQTIESLTFDALGAHIGLGREACRRFAAAVFELQSLGHARDGTWMIGDAISDIREGKRAGVRTAAVTWGYQPESVLAAEQPERIVRSVGALRELG